MRATRTRKKVSPAGFREHLRDAFCERFGVAVQTTWNIALCRLVTTRLDGQDFTKEQAAWIAGYEAGYDPNDEGRA